MKLAELSWTDVREIPREIVVMAPTGALEQHGPHMPLGTDFIIATAVAEAVEAAFPDRLLLVPTLWLGLSHHHMSFAGTVSASFESYEAALSATISSLAHHGFRRFMVLNGHGGNSATNAVTLRKLRHANRSLRLASIDWWGFDGIGAIMEGPLKAIRHACEGETSMMLHLRPDLVRMERARDDGLAAETPVSGEVLTFDEVTERGNFGYSTLATAEKGKAIFEASVAFISAQVEAFAKPSVLMGLAPQKT